MRTIASKRLAVFFLGLAILLAAAASADAAMSDSEKALYDAAKKEGAVTWYVAQFPESVAQPIAKAFSEKFPGINVNVIRTTGQVAFQRITQELKANALECDVMSSTDLSHYVSLKQEGRLETYRPGNAAGLNPAFRDMDPDGILHSTTVAAILLGYNTAKVKAEDAPKKWSDLADPKWKGQITMGHPAFSGYAGIWYAVLTKLYGWSLFEKIAKLDPQISRSMQDTVTLMSSGERTVGVTIDGGARQAMQRGNPMNIVFPSDGTIVVNTPSAILKASPHPNAAKLFMEFLLSEDAATLEVKEGFIGVNAKAGVPAGMKPFSEIPIIAPKIEDFIKGIPEVKEKFRDTYGI